MPTSRETRFVSISFTSCRSFFVDDSSWLNSLSDSPTSPTQRYYVVYCYQPSSVVCRSVCRYVCQSVTLVSPAKTAEPIEMPFGLGTRVCPRNHVSSATSSTISTDFSSSSRLQTTGHWLLAVKKGDTLLILTRNFGKSHNYRSCHTLSVLLHYLMKYLAPCWPTVVNGSVLHHPV